MQQLEVCWVLVRTLVCLSSLECSLLRTWNRYDRFHQPRHAFSSSLVLMDIWLKTVDGSSKLLCHVLVVCPYVVGWQHAGITKLFRIYFASA